MINEFINKSTDEYLLTFEKKFKNFMSKSPCKLNITITPMSIILTDSISKKSKTFEFNYLLEVKDFISEIKKWLVENVYPIIIEKIEKKYEYTSEEIRKMIDEGIDVDQLLLSKKMKIIENKYRIERILLYSKQTNYKKDRIFTRNLQTGIESLWELNIPGSVFLNNILKKWTPEYSYQVFLKNAIYLNDIDPNYGKIKNEEN